MAKSNIPGSAQFDPNKKIGELIDESPPAAPRRQPAPPPLELTPESVPLGGVDQAVAGVAQETPQAAGLEGPPVAPPGAESSPFANTMAATPIVEQVRKAVPSLINAAPSASPAPESGDMGESEEPRVKSRLDLEREVIEGQRGAAEEELANQQINARLREQELNDLLVAQQEAARKAREDVRGISEEQLDPSRFTEDMGTFGWIAALLGGFAGGAVGRPEAMSNLIQAKIKQDLDLQRRNKDSRLNAATARLNSAEAAENAITARYYNAVAETVRSQKALGGFRAETQGVLDTLEQQAQIAAQDAQNAAIAQERAWHQKAYQTKLGELQAKRVGAPSAAKPAAGSRLYQLAEKNGIPDAAVKEFVNSKLEYGGKNIATWQFADGAERLANYRADLASAIAEPSEEGFIAINGRMRQVLKKMGIGGYDDKDRIDVERIYNQLVTQQAKEFGGVITDSDREMAGRIIGRDKQEMLRFLDSKLSDAKNTLGSLARTQYRGQAQALLPGIAPSLFGAGINPYKDTN